MGVESEMPENEVLRADYLKFPIGLADPILGAIDALRVGLADYNANAPLNNDEAANAYAEKSYRHPRQALVAWDGPALTFAGAYAALKMAKDADESDDAEIVRVMINAAIGYFETQF
jgi:hypothetical protein